MPFKRIGNWFRNLRAGGNKETTTIQQRPNAEHHKSTFLAHLAEAGKVNVNVLSEFDNLPQEVQGKVFADLVAHIDPAEEYATKQVLKKIARHPDIRERTELLTKILGRLTQKQKDFYFKHRNHGAKKEATVRNRSKQKPK